MFARLAEEAQSQATYWEAELAKTGGTTPDFKPSARARMVAFLARRLGPRRLKPALAALKIRGLSAYSSAPPGGHPLPTTIEDVGRGHRQLGGSSLRAAIFGVNDGLVSNVSLILGMVGAQASTHTVLATGVAGLLAGALSMAAGEFVSVRSQRELYEHQIALEADELEQYPQAEAEELALIYAARGLPLDQARELAQRLIADPRQALDVLAREELGLNPDDLGKPVGAAAASLVSFAGGALLPLLPFFAGLQLPSAAYAGAACGGLGLFATGATLSLFSGRNALFGGARMLAIGAAAAALTWAIGRMIGVSVA